MAGLMEGYRLELKENEQMISSQLISEAFFERFKRFLELIESDEKALTYLDKAIEFMEKPKKEVTQKIADKLMEVADMKTMLQEALMCLPEDELKNMETKIDELKMTREPGGDCLIIHAGDQSRRINL